jgi:hypothetical protein
MSSQQQFALDFTQKRPPEVQAKIADGMQRCDDNASEKWKHMWDAIVVAVARKKYELTSDDVLEEYEKLKHPPGTHNLAAIGPAMKRGATMGVLTRTDRVVRSTRIEKNGNIHYVWISNHFEGAR